MAGSLRGRRIACLDRPELRPTTDRAREALFSILGDLGGVRVLDLYAGTGALGIEALSRGADRVVLVESDGPSARHLRTQLAAFGLAERAAVVHARLPLALTELAAREDPFDLILADPPYAGSLGRETLGHPSFGALVAREGRVVLEHAAKVPSPEPPAGWVLTASRRYGSTAFSTYRRSATADHESRTYAEANRREDG